MQGLLSTCCALDSGSVEGAAAGALLPAQKEKKKRRPAQELHPSA